MGGPVVSVLKPILLLAFLCGCEFCHRFGKMIDEVPIHTLHVIDHDHGARTLTQLLCDVALDLSVGMHFFTARTDVVLSRTMCARRAGGGGADFRAEPV